MTTPTRAYGYRGIKIHVACDDAAHLCWLDEFLTPAFTPVTGQVDCSVRLVMDPERFARWQAAGHTGAELTAFILDNGERRLAAWHAPAPAMRLYDPDVPAFYHVTGREITVLGGHWRPPVRSALMRPVRELAMDAAQQRGGLLLHAAACAVDGRAMIIAGPKQAGKTSLLTYALAAAGADYCSNDRLLLHLNNSGLRARSLPTVVSIRAGTLDLFPDIRHKIVCARWNLHSTLAECTQPHSGPTRIWNDRLCLTPRQYTAACGCAAVASAKPAVLLFPHRTGQPGGLTLEPISTEQRVARLAGSLFGASAHLPLSEIRRSDVFCVPAGCASHQRAAVLEELAGLPTYVCLLGTDAYADRRGAEKLLRILAD